MIKQTKQLATSKRMGFGTLLNIGWLTITLTELKQLRLAGESLFDGYVWGDYVGMGIVVIASLGLAWTKIHDDSLSNHQPR